MEKIWFTCPFILDTSSRHDDLGQQEDNNVCKHICLIHFYLLDLFVVETWALLLQFIYFVQDDVENDVNYAALHFSGGKAKKGKKKPMDESVYSQVKY